MANIQPIAPGATLDDAVVRINDNFLQVVATYCLSHPLIGAVGDGVTDDGPALARLSTSAAIMNDEMVVADRGVYRVGSSQTVNRPLRCNPGARFDVAAGATLTLTRGVEAGLFPIFGGGGQVVFSPGTVPEVYPQWFGAKGDGVADDAPAVQRALSALAASGGGRLFFPPGTYLMNTRQDDAASQTSYAVQVRSDNISITGSGRRSVLRAGPNLVLTGTQKSAYLVEIQGDVVDFATHASARKNCTVSELSFVGLGRDFPNPSGIHGAPYSEQVVVSHCHFENLGLWGAVDLSSSYKGKICDNVAVGCGCAYQLSGTTVTHSTSITANVAIDCWEAYSVQFGEACIVANNAAFYTPAYVASFGNYAFRVSGQRGARVTGNVVDARALPASQKLRTGIELGMDAAVVGGPQFGYPTHCSVIGNHVVGGVDRGIRLIGGQFNIIEGNTIGDHTAPRTVAVGIELAINSQTQQRSENNQVRGNIISPDPGTGVGIREPNNEARGNVIVDNHVTRAAPGSAIVLNTTARPVSSVARNKGFMTEASGTVLIPVNAQMVNVNLSAMGFARDVGYKDLRVSLCGAYGAKAPIVSAANLTNVGTRRFDIVLNGPNNTGGPVTVSWAIEVT